MVSKEFDLGFCNAHVGGGSHIVMFYDEYADFQEILPQYFSNGLNAGDLILVAYNNKDFLDIVHNTVSTGIHGKNPVGKDKLVAMHYKDCYFVDEAFTTQKVYDYLNTQLDDPSNARSMRTIGDMSWAKEEFFDRIIAYETEITEKYMNKNIAMMCAYPTKGLSASKMIEIIQSHNMILFKRDGKWILSEPTDRKMLREEIMDLQKFMNLAVEREMKMVDLKKKIKELESMNAALRQA